MKTQGFCSPGPHREALKPVRFKGFSLPQRSPGGPKPMKINVFASPRSFREAQNPERPRHLGHGLGSGLAAARAAAAWAGARPWGVP